MRPGCHCGTCPRCVERERKRVVRESRQVASDGCRCGMPKCDCAEWDRIYREKFEDPTYYGPREPGGAASSLTFAIKYFQPLDDVSSILRGEEHGARMRSIVAGSARAASARRCARERG
jgi:hypothetical protein